MKAHMFFLISTCLYLSYIFSCTPSFVMANTTEQKFYYIQPEGSRFFTSDNYGSKITENTFITSTNIWKFATATGYIFKLTFVHIELSNNANIDCFDGIYVYDGEVQSNGSLLAQLCGSNWETQPVFHSTKNAITVKLFSENRIDAQSFVAQVESTTESSLMNLLFVCNSTLVLKEEILYSFFLKSNSEMQLPMYCHNSFNILPRYKWKSFVKVSILSLSFNPGKAKKMKNCQNQLWFSDEKDNQFHFCGYSPPKTPLLFFSSFFVFVKSDELNHNQGFFLTMKLLYCHEDMTWDPSYCSQLCTVTCKSVVSKQIENTRCSESCHFDCRCPPDKPVFHANRCVTADECIDYVASESVVISETSYNSEILMDNNDDETNDILSDNEMVHHRQRRSTIYKLCTDKSEKVGFCEFHKSIGHCSRQSILDQCAFTCDWCTLSPSWTTWTSWTSCNRDCGDGKRLRIQVCTDCSATKYEVEVCASTPCYFSPEYEYWRQLDFSESISNDDLYYEDDEDDDDFATDLEISGRSHTGFGFGQEKDEKLYRCGANSFACENHGCLRDVLECNGYYECDDRSDEHGNCPLGFRFDGKRAIMNWATHKCFDIKKNETTGEIRPWAYRRCPGQSGPELNRYWWTYNIGNRLTHIGIIRHIPTNLCLECNVSKNGNESFTEILLKPCDFTFNNLNQLWYCIPGTLNVRLTFFHKVLPPELRQYKYLSISREGPGKYLLMANATSAETTEFHILETFKIPICAGRGKPPIWIPPDDCSKSCGNGSKKVLRDCARFGRMDCNKGDKYKLIPCNTHPCIDFCPPNWSVMSSKNNQEDKNCFKAFLDESRSYTDAKAFCAAQNWSLAAIKNEDTEEFVRNLVKEEPKVYIGLYEDLSKSPDGAPTHSLRYDYDRQPVGGFHPFIHYGTKDNSWLPGCMLGRGTSYYGTQDDDQESNYCEYWKDTGTRARWIPFLEKPLFKPPIKPDHCRNPTGDPKGLWCYTGKDSFGYCNVTDCLDVPTKDGSGKAFPEIDFRHIFLIRARHGIYWKRKYCLSSPITYRDDSPEYAQVWPCEYSDVRQRFFWWSSTSLVNIGLKKCLSLLTGPPKHNDKLVFSPCQRREDHTLQAWKGRDGLLLSDWRPDSGVLGTQLPLLKVDQDLDSYDVFLSDMRIDLFVVWSKRLGMVRASKISRKSPGGPYVLLRSCEGCITHDKLEGYDIIRTTACAQQHLTQRWIILGNGRLMNADSGMCLASFRMHAYAIAVYCDFNDKSQLWNWNSNITHEITKVRLSTLQHQATKYYLRCDCQGLSSLCLSPSPNSTWEFLPASVRPTEKGRASTHSRASARGIFGFPFFLQSSYNLSKCARPTMDSSDWNNGDYAPTSIKVIFQSCKLDDTGFLWWFSGAVTQIKHRNLDLCVDAGLNNITEEDEFDHLEVHLRPCSLERLKDQSWVFASGPTPRDPNELPGDFVRLAANKNFYLSVKFVTNTEVNSNHKNFVLIVKRDDNSDTWDAVTLRGNVVGLSEMIDCALPWEKMINYRGSRSWTRDGFRCQPWNSQMPHRHPFWPKNFFKHGLDGSECRRPPGPATKIMDAKSEDHAFCMTLNPNVPWQDCLVSRCPLPAVVSLLDTKGGTWEVSLGKEPRPFVCQTTGECYYGVGLEFSGHTNWTGRDYCLNWRKYFNGNKKWPDNRHCRNPSASFMKPWCFVARNVPQYCDTIKQCVKYCVLPNPGILRRMKIANIKYNSPSPMYAAGSKVQFICKQGYNLTGAPLYNYQELKCQSDGSWIPELIECRKIFCPKPYGIDNAHLLTSKSRYVYGSKAAYQCKSGYMIQPGQISIEISCLKNGVWSKTKYECLPACPDGWTSFNQSCYVVKSHYKKFINYDGARKECMEFTDATLAVPESEVAFKFLSWLTKKDPEKIYWLGVRDDAASEENLADREWEPDGRTTALYTDALVPYHQFKIRNFGSTIEREERFAYTDRCMFGDSKTRKVRLKSCSFEDKTGLFWTWLTHDRLYNVDTGLCLAVDQYNGLGGATGLSPGSVRLEKCSFTENSQSLTCGPFVGYLLKPRYLFNSYLAVLPDNQFSEVMVGGEQVTGPLAMWHTFPGGKYLCHWEVKPPDTYFIVHRGFVPPFNSFSTYEPHKCLQDSTGAKLASIDEVKNYGIKNTRVNWCACLYMLDDKGKLASAAAVQNEPCTLSNTRTSRVTASDVHVCDAEETTDSLCKRTDGSSPKDKPIPDWCLTLTHPDPLTQKIEPRFCYTLLPGYICQTDARWSCETPYEPPNTISTFDSADFSSMRFAYGRTHDITCKPGYRFPGVYETVKIICNQYLNWELIKTSGVDEVETYVDDRIEREEGIRDLRCYIVNCSAPIDITGMTWTADNAKEGLYPYGTTAVYVCNEGTYFASGDENYTVTCSAEETWEKMPGDETKCIAIECGQPPPIERATLFVSAFVFGAVSRYTCGEGYWFRRNEQTLIVTCNGSALWFPDPSKEKCVPVTCITPDKIDLARMVAEQAYPKQDMSLHGTNITIKCLPYYWFDKETFTAQFECAIDGYWRPFSPNRLQCVPVHCDYPLPVAGSIMWGSDNRAGSHIRYECASTNWIRRAFQIYSPHWGLCIRAIGGLDPDFLEPTKRHLKGSLPLSVKLHSDCARGGLRDVWVWHWSFHLKNKYTDTCLTATAMPRFEEDDVTVTIEKCVIHNIFQQWRCAKVRDGTNSRLLSLRTAKRAAYLTTYTDELAFWSGDADARLVVTGNNSATGLESYWQVYGTPLDSDVDICSMREGHLYEHSVCNSFGKWVPDHHTIECTLVDCGPPPALLFANKTIILGNTSTLTKFHFKPPNLQDYRRFPTNPPQAEHYYPVFTLVTFECDIGKWVRKNVFYADLMCRENGLWQYQDTGEYIRTPHAPEVIHTCKEVWCVPPQVLTYSVAIVYPATTPKYLNGKRVLPYMGAIQFVPRLNLTYKPVYGSRAEVICELGFWILKKNIKVIPEEWKQRKVAGSRTIKSTCDENGQWTEPIIEKGIDCVPATCFEPGLVVNSRRFPDKANTSVFEYGSIFQYQCDAGYWFSPVQTYTESRCNTYGNWEPDPKDISCIIAKCRNPGEVPFASRIGKDYTVWSEVIYTCNAGRLIGRSLKSMKSICQPTGLWFPPASSIECALLTCDYIPHIPHTTIYNVSKVHQQFYFPGDKISMKCNHGYSIDPSTISVTYDCDYDGKWQPRLMIQKYGEIRCEPIHCPPPPDVLPSGAMLDGLADAYLLGDIVRYRCPLGKLIGPRGLDVAEETVCTAKPTVDPPALFPEMYWHQNLTNLTCKVVICPYPGVVKNAILHTTNLTYGFTASYTCRTGYRVTRPYFEGFVSTVVVKCGFDGRWTPDPSLIFCTPNLCPDPGDVHDAYREKDSRTNGRYFYGDVVTYKCNNKKYLRQLDYKGNSLPGQVYWTVTCLADGKWDFLPGDYFVSCQPVTCRVPGLIPNTNVTTSYKSSIAPSEYPLGTVYNITCRPGLVISLYGLRSMSVICGDYGSWEPVDPDLASCERVHCRDPGEKINASRIVTGLRVGDRITYIGDDGFLSIGYPFNETRRSVTIVCTMTGDWAVVENEDLIEENNYPHTRRKRDVGHSRKKRASSVDRYITFMHGGCSIPVVTENVKIRTNNNANVSNATIIIPTKKRYIFNDRLTLDCDPGYMISRNTNSTEIVCSDTSEWFPVPQHIHCFKESDFFCDLPQTVPNATIHLTSYKVGETATIACLAGYGITGIGAELRITCTQSGKWEPSGQGIACRKIDCSNPPTVPSATFNFTGTRYGDKAHYKCNYGYSFTGLANDTALTTVCQSDSWIPDVTKSPCRSINCGDPTYLNFPNTKKADYGDTLYGSSAVFECKDGFRYINSSGKIDDITVWCSIEGIWQYNEDDSEAFSGKALPSCEFATCNDPPTFANSYLNLIGGHSFNAKAIYHCKTGYRVNPPGASSKVKTFTATCKDNGTWNLPATYSCVVAQCPDISSRPSAKVAYTNNTTPAYAYRGTATQKCNRGYTSSFGDSVLLECMWYGKWSPPLTLATCKLVQCPTPPVMPHATASGGRSVGNSWNYTCGTNYEITKTSRMVSMKCNFQGLWIPHYNTLKKCRFKSCDIPHTYPANSRAVTHDGRTVVATDTNFYIKANEVVTFVCSEGYWIQTTKATTQTSKCDLSKSWTPGLATLINCQRVSCPLPALSTDISFVGGKQLTYFFQNTATLACSTSLHFRSLRLKVATIKCNMNGSFTPDPSTLACSTVQCVDHHMPLADRVILTNAALGGLATYRCHTGAWFEPSVKSKQYECDINGRWHPDVEVEKCKTITCDVPTIPNSVIAVTKLEYGAALNVFCKEGFYLSASDVMRCTESGSIEPHPSTFICNRLECQEPTLPDNTFAVNATYAFGRPLVIQCKAGYWISPGVFSTTISCLKTGRWSADSTKIICVPLRCELPPTPVNGSINGDSNSYKSEIILRCDKGHKLSGSTGILKVQCGSDAQWRPRPILTCILVRCGSPPEIPFAKLTVNGQTYGSTAEYTCQALRWISHRGGYYWNMTGYKRAVSVCNEDGVWDPYASDKYRCNSIYEGDVQFAGNTVKGKGIGDRNHPPYHTLITSKPAKWLSYDPKVMTVSDSYVATGASDEISNREIRFIWDDNALTFWVAPVVRLPSSTPGTFQWSIDVYLGTPKAVFGFMIMCVDDGHSDITKFSLVYAGRDKKSKTIGPFKVYGQKGISGTPDPNFNINYSSVATAWIYSGFSEEMQWCHLVLHGTLKSSARPAVREISFYASEAEWEWSYPIDPTPVMALSSAILALLTIFSTIMFYFDETYLHTVVHTPPITNLTNKKEPRNVYKITFSSHFEKVPGVAKHLLVHLRDEASRSKKIPVSWLRGNDFPKLFRSINNRCSIILSSDEAIKSDYPSVDFIAWSVAEDPHIGHTKGDEDSYKPLSDMKISNVQVYNSTTGEHWVLENDPLVITFEQGARYPVSSRSVLSVHLERLVMPDWYYYIIVRMLLCHHFVAILYPPPNSQLNRLERFLTSMLVIVVGVVATINMQIYFDAFPVEDTPPNVELFAENENTIKRDNLTVFGGKSAFATFAFFSCLMCIPLAYVVRLLYRLAEAIADKLRAGNNVVYAFCSHIAYFHPPMLRLPFMKTLKTPLSNLLGVVFKDVMTVDVSTSVPGDFFHGDVFSKDSNVERRWSSLHPLDVDLVLAKKGYKDKDSSFQGGGQDSDSQENDFGAKSVSPFRDTQSIVSRASDNRSSSRKSGKSVSPFRDNQSIVSRASDNRSSSRKSGKSVSPFRGSPWNVHKKEVGIDTNIDEAQGDVSVTTLAPFRDDDSFGEERAPSLKASKVSKQVRGSAITYGKIIYPRRTKSTFTRLETLPQQHELKSIMKPDQYVFHDRDIPLNMSVSAAPKPSEDAVFSNTPSSSILNTQSQLPLSTSSALSTGDSYKLCEIEDEAINSSTPMKTPNNVKIPCYRSALKSDIGSTSPSNAPESSVSPFSSDNVNFHSNTSSPMFTKVSAASPFTSYDSGDTEESYGVQPPKKHFGSKLAKIPARRDWGNDTSDTQNEQVLSESSSDAHEEREVEQRYPKSTVRNRKSAPLSPHTVKNICLEIDSVCEEVATECRPLQSSSQSLSPKRSLESKRTAYEPELTHDTEKVNYISDSDMLDEESVVINLESPPTNEFLTADCNLSETSPTIKASMTSFIQTSFTKLSNAFTSATSDNATAPFPSAGLFQSKAALSDSQDSENNEELKVSFAGTEQISKKSKARNSDSSSDIDSVKFPRQIISPSRSLQSAESSIFMGLDCYGDSRLHHKVVTHCPSRNNMCPSTLQPRSLVSGLIIGSILAFAVHLFFLGQYVSSNAKKEVNSGACLSAFFTVFITMVVDAGVGMLAFGEHSTNTE